MTTRAALGILLLASAASATWYYPNVERGSDIVMGDVRWPYWPNATYFALWNMSTVPEGGPFYGGVAPYGPGKAGSPDEQAAYRPQLVWSFWGDPSYGGDRARPIYTDDPFYGGSMSGEGATAGVCGYFPYLRPNRWFRMVMRAWPSRSAPESLGYVGWWIQDREMGTWRLVGVVSLPCAVTGFGGNACFVEDCGAGSTADRVIERRLGYHRLNGEWRKTDSIWVDGAVPATRFSLTEGGGVLRFEAPEPPPPAGAPVPRHEYRVEQPDSPDLGEPAIVEAEATAIGDQVCVCWSIPEDATPQLGYTIEAFASADGSGEPLATCSDTLPYVHVATLDAPRPVGSVRLSVIDLFDRRESVLLPTRLAQPLPQARPRLTTPGIAFRYWEAPEGADWQSLPDLSGVAPRYEGIARTLDDTVRLGRAKLYALEWSGYLEIPQTRTWILEARASDGYRLELDGAVILEHEGIHGPTPHRVAATLSKGPHAFRFRYFKSGYDAMDGWLRDKVWLGIEGPGTPLRALEEEDFLCEPGEMLGGFSLIALRQADRPVRLTPVVRPRGHTFDRIEYFSGRSKLGERPGSESLELYLPRGRNDLWARLWYDGRYAVDSRVASVDADDWRLGPWTPTVVGEPGSQSGFQASPDSISLTGEGSLFAHQPVEGDFVLRGRIADFAHADATNGLDARSSMGLLAAADPATPWGAMFGLWDTAGLGLRGAPDDRDLEGSGMSRDRLGTEDRWLRIARRGMRWIAWTSPDGTAWQKVLDRIDGGIPAKVEVGVFLRTIPDKNASLCRGTLEEILLEQPGSLPPEDAAPLPPRPLQGAVALVRGRGDSALLARGPQIGLLRSTDEGETWVDRNAGLDDPASLATRSVAVHPADGNVVLRGGGGTVEGRLVSGLWRSADAGATWDLVSREVDFDGAGPSAALGEAIAFCPQRPELVAAGGESTGLWLSEDAGLTWRSAGLEGERIGFAAWSPYQAGLLVVGTCPDEALRDLALGEPTVSAGDAGRLYTLSGFGRELSLRAEQPGLGFASVAFESIAEGGSYLYFATTRGLYYTYDLRGLHQRRSGVAPDTPYLALEEWAATGKGRSRILTGPLDTGEPTLYSGAVGYYWSPVWSPLSEEEAVPGRRLTSVLSHPTSSETWWLCVDGEIRRTDDGGRTYRAP